MGVASLINQFLALLTAFGLTASLPAVAGYVDWSSDSGTDSGPAEPSITLLPRLSPTDRGPALDGDVLRIDLDSGATLDRSTTDPYTKETSVHTVEFPHSINDDIYGMNFAPASLLEELQISVHRWGGNSAERYNYTNDASVIGADWYFMSFTDDPDADHQFEQTNNSFGVSTQLQVPIGGWVTGDNAARCGFAVSTPDGTGSSAGWQDDSQSHFDDPALECGSGTRDGERLAADPWRTSVPSDESFVANWITELVATHGTAAEGGVESYALGNEPNLWADTHRDLFDLPPERQEIISRNQTYAAAIKQADPTAAVYGPVLWGGTSFFGTSAEFDRAEYPGSNETFVAEYLAAMRTASEVAGVRLLDGLDLHFYDGRVYPTGPADQRVEATRSLWDSSYIAVDWWALNVGNDTNPGRVESIGLIPRMRSLIDQNYPGTDLAITEYNFGSLDTIDGAIAQADALGIFGREGVDRAMLWDPLDPPSTPGEAEYVDRPGIWAFRMFRNADSAGQRFGDEAIFAESYDEAELSIYAARRSQDGAVTLMIINKTNTPISTQVDLDGLVGLATTYRYDESDLGRIQNLGQAEVAGSVAGNFAAMSISLIVISTS